MIRPLGHRVLVRPDAQETRTDGGLHLIEDREHIPTSGTVIALGHGTQREHQVRQHAIRDCMETLTAVDLLYAAEELAPLIGSFTDDHEIAIGDQVVFTVEAGTSMVYDGELVIVLNEEDCVVVVRDDKEIDSAA